MISMMRFYLIPVLLLAGAMFSFAQVDPTKALIGTWEGQLEISRGQMGRTLTINSVKAKGEGEWVARGRYATAGLESDKTTGGSEITVTSKDSEIYVEFASGNAKNPVKLKLVGDNKLVGTADLGGKTGERRLTLEKAAPKAGDVK